MRLNSAPRIVLFALLIVPGIVIWRSEANLFAEQRLYTPRTPKNQALAVQSVVSAPPSPTNLRFTHLSVADGLSHADVRAIVQDRQGFMWFGTWLGGLNRYDGYTFKVYKHDDQDDRSLGSNTVWGLYVDRAGALWVGTNKGADRYDSDTDSFIHYRSRDDDASLSPYQVHSFIEDESGTLWASSAQGPQRFDRASNRFVSYRPGPNAPPSFGDSDLHSMCMDATTGLLWLGTFHEGVIVLDRKTGHSLRYANNPTDPSSLSNNDVDHIFQDRKGNLWISTLRGLNRFDPKTHTFIRYLHDPKNPANLSDDYVAMTYEDRVGRFWVATNNGLNLMDRDRGTFVRYLHDPNDPSGLSSNVINPGALYEDVTGSLWIGMRSTGVDRLAGEAERFTTYRHVTQDAKGPSSNVITVLARGSAGELWIGTEAGLDRFDGQTFTHYLADPNNTGSLSPGPHRSVVQDSRGTIWTGTYGSGLDRLEKGRVTHFRHDPKNPNSPANDNIASLVADSAGGVWIGVHGKGLDYFDGRHFTHFPPEPGIPDGLQDGYVLPLLLDPRGILWLGSGHCGLVRFDTHKRKFTTYPLDPNQPGNQAVNWIEDAYSDGTSIWVASPTTGLFRFEPETGKFTRHYTEKDGLPSDTVLGVLGDAQGNIWIGTANGLSKLDLKTETFRNYDMYDGLQGNGFSAHCHAKARDGLLFFGGTNGLSAFYPNKLVDNPTPPPVVLTEFELFNKPVKVGGKDSPLRQAIQVASSIALRYDQSVLRFQFAALNYDSPQKNKYAYKLESFDRDWQNTDAERRLATYTNLDPGDYTFRVKASNNDGVWNEQGLALHLTILPPWWKTNWFRAISAAAFLAFVWGLYQLRIRQLRQQEEKFRQAVESMPALAFVASSENERTFVNKGWVEYTGLTVEQALGSGWQAAVHPDDLKRVVDKWRTAVTTGEPLDYEVRLRHAVDGQYRWFHTRVVPLQDKRGKIVKWCGVATDIEDRKRAEQLQADLAHTNRVSMLGELAASIAHEVNQPLSGIVSNASATLRWLARDAPNMQEACEAARSIVRDGQRAGEIIHRLRSLYKKIPPKQESVDVNEIIGEMVVMLRGEANRFAISIRTDLAADLPEITADRVQLQQVLMNLMLNGIEAMHDTGGVLTTKSQPEDGHVLISVSDTGVGLPPEKAERIFDAFYTTKPQGSGMGLAISRSIVESHCGRLWATPNDGRGASFHFSLPTPTVTAEAPAREA